MFDLLGSIMDVKGANGGSGISDEEWNKIYDGLVQQYMQNPTPPPSAPSIPEAQQPDMMRRYQPAESMGELKGLLSMASAPVQRQPMQQVQMDPYIKSLLRI